MYLHVCLRNQCSASWQNLTKYWAWSPFHYDSKNRPEIMFWEFVSKQAYPWPSPGQPISLRQQEPPWNYFLGACLKASISLTFTRLPEGFLESGNVIFALSLEELWGTCGWAFRRCMPTGQSDQCFFHRHRHELPCSLIEITPENPQSTLGYTEVSR